MAHTVDINAVIRRAYVLQHSTPEHMRVAPASIKPLPPGPLYPVFTDYPSGSVDQQRLERQRIAAAEEDIARRRRVVSELEARRREVAFHTDLHSVERQQLQVPCFGTLMWCPDVGACCVGVD